MCGVNFLYHAFGNFITMRYILSMTKNTHEGNGEITSWLRVCNVLTEDLDSVPSTPGEVHNHL